MRKPTEAPLMVITSGSLPPNPSELLTSDRMVRFLNEAKELVDIIILDSPPFLVSDASILYARVDGVILVILPGKTHTDSIKVMLEQTGRVGERVLGLVFNRIPRSRGYYYGGYRHYKGYYYHGYHGHNSYYLNETPKTQRKNGKAKGNASLGNFAPSPRQTDSESGLGPNDN